MPSENPTRRLLDIVENAQSIARYTTGIANGSEFEENQLVSDAVERCLERICEAVTKLGDEAAILLPGQPWQKIKALGNVLRHDYDDVIRGHLWEVIQRDLPSLVQACEEALKKHSYSEGQ